MRKIKITALVLAVAFLIGAMAMLASADTTINFMPELRDGKIYGIPQKTLVSTLQRAYYNYDVRVYDLNKNAVSSSTDYIGTGYTVKINGISYIAIVFGDVDGDGVSDAEGVKEVWGLLEEGLWVGSSGSGSLVAEDCPCSSLLSSVVKVSLFSLQAVESSAVINSRARREQIFLEKDFMILPLVVRLSKALGQGGVCGWLSSI